MSLATDQAAVKLWVRALLGFAARDPVVMENEPRPAFERVIATLAWVSRVRRGVDELRYEDSEEAAPADNLTPVVVGARVRVLQVTVETVSQAPDAPSALDWCEHAQDRMHAPSSRAALAAANLGLVGAQVVTLADLESDQHMNARAVLDVRLNATSFERDAAGATGSIESVELTSDTLKGVDGVDLPAAQQFDHEVIP